MRRACMASGELRSFLSPSINALSSVFSSSINAHLCSLQHLFNPLSKQMADHSQFKLFCNRVFMAVISCTVALGGATVGTIAGTIKGPTTETGLLRGAGVGAVTGAITALQLMDMIVNDEPFSKVSFLCSLVNGQIFADWVTPAVLKAYQWQISGVETTFADLFDGCENNGSTGLCEESINKLPRFEFDDSSKRVGGNGSFHDSKCAICLQNFKNRKKGENW